MNTEFLKLGLPDYKASSNWAAVMNDNLIKIDSKFAVLASQINTTQTRAEIELGTTVAYSVFSCTLGKTSGTTGDTITSSEMSIDLKNIIIEDETPCFINTFFSICEHQTGTWTITPIYLNYTATLERREEGSSEFVLTLNVDSGAVSDKVINGLVFLYIPIKEEEATPEPGES